MTAAHTQLSMIANRADASPHPVLNVHAFQGAGLAFLKKGEIEICESFGTVRDHGKMVTDKTLFQAASISKTINALAVMKFVQEGKIEIDRPVNDQLKRWRLPGRYAQKVTPAMLLSHTAGTNVPGFDGYLRGDSIPTLLDVLNGTGSANSAPIVADLQPGAFRYSGGGTTVLQLLLEDVVGLDYEAIISREVLEPLSMLHSTMAGPDPDTAEVALGHDNEANLLEGGYRIHPELAAAGLWTTPSDLCKACHAIIQSLNGRPGAFLQPEIAARMYDPVSDITGLGMFVFNDGVFSHAGYNAGFVSLFLADPASESAVAIMANTEVNPLIFEELFSRIPAEFPFRM